jgi:hypothetical protein
MRRPRTATPFLSMEEAKRLGCELDDIHDLPDA